MKMKSLLHIIFKKEAKLNETIAAYAPTRDYAFASSSENDAEYEFETMSEADDMQIDKMYRSL
jgi:hypothetical protein